VRGSPRLCRRRERRLIGARFGRWREERVGRARCLTLRYSLLLSALWDCVSRVCGSGGGCAGGGVPLGADPCCPDVGRCLSGVNIIICVR